MSNAHFVTVAVVLGSALCIAGCSGPPQEALATTEGAAAAALREAGAVDKLGETRWASKGAGRAQSAPSFVVDASWPKPLPTIGASARSAESPWTRTTTSGSITGRGRWTRARPARCREWRRTSKACRSARSAIRDPTPNSSTGCCVPAPSVLKFDREGNLLAAWGGPSDPGFLDEQLPRGGRLFLAGARARHLRGPERLRVPRPATARTAGPVSSRAWRRIRGRRLSATIRTC